MLEGIHVVDSLANERSFPEEILVDIGYDARVGVHPGIAREQPDKQRAVGTRQTDADARL